jgi:hypothetical protein
MATLVQNVAVSGYYLGSWQLVVKEPCSFHLNVFFEQHVRLIKRNGRLPFITEVDFDIQTILSWTFSSIEKRWLTTTLTTTTTMSATTLTRNICIRKRITFVRPTRIRELEQNEIVGKRSN